ncbi:glycosyl hydrolase [Streptomyces fodineus]|uniref:Glycosyl hydrolase n=1 Tax=Streptomyces fodineus TaxID=1904616 RepID=A0A1D7Y4L1_9ACTN|nr:ThuA domain-containing protein [Streptomyces fodineus]AOR30537.1 glycosyl hydrolase [Streptomyces fodineus]
MRMSLTKAACWLSGALLCVAAAPGLASAEPVKPTESVKATTRATADPAYKVLVFSKTAGYRHSSIDAGLSTLRELGSANNFTVDATEDAGAFTADNLANYKAVVFLSTTGDVLDAAQQDAFESYIRGGGGFVGIHAAADTEYDWPFYGKLVGAYFQSHPDQQNAKINVEDRAHPATAHLGSTWERFDEWYNYRTNPRSTAHVLASLDESSYSGGTMSGDHPITWCQNYEGGRSFYTGLGHTDASYSEPAFQQELLGGIRWAAGMAQADCRPENGYQSLFDGSSTTGWEQAGPGSFDLADGTLTSKGGMGLLWYDAKELKGDYSIKADWKMDGDDNSGIFVGFPASNDPWSAVNNGYEIQIDATDSPDRTTGAVYGFKAPDTAVRDKALNPPGEWNTFEIRVTGEHLEVFLNGVKINDFTNTDPARSLQQGYVGLQNHSDADRVSFRNVRVKTTYSRTGEVKGVNGKCMDVAGGKDDDETQVQLYGCNSTAAQQWTLPGDGTIRALGKCLDVRWAGTDDGTKVQLYRCNGTVAQQWVPQDDGTVRNPNSGKCLDAEGDTWGDETPIHLWTCHGKANQQWTLPS